MKYSIIGYGGRGCLYSWCFKNCGAELVSVCDSKDERLTLAQGNHGVANDRLFKNADDFFAQGKMSELCVIATQDESHYEIAMRALEIGYDLMLEKPIATSFEKCEAIYESAKRLGRRIFVCHVLRYAPFFQLIKKELDSGKYGKVETINMTENVAYWHQAHSYVRGNWRRAEDSTPMIVAKCCHDLDILVWLIGADCKYVSSMGSLSLFKKENKPTCATARCVDCPLVETCPYSAVKFYIHDKYEQGEHGWPCDVLTLKPTKESLLQALKEGPYGRCVFECDNDVVDHQVVNVEFDGGTTAHLTMTAFSKDCYREIHVHAEYGDIYGNMEENVLHCNIFGGETKDIDIAGLSKDKMAGHGGGDERLVQDVVDFYEGKAGVGLTTIEKSIMSHKIAFSAEESRVGHGVLIDVGEKDVEN